MVVYLWNFIAVWSGFLLSTVQQQLLGIFSNLIRCDAITFVLCTHFLNLSCSSLHTCQFQGLFPQLYGHICQFQCFNQQVIQRLQQFLACFSLFSRQLHLESLVTQAVTLISQHILSVISNYRSGLPLSQSLRPFIYIWLQVEFYSKQCMAVKR